MGLHHLHVGGRTHCIHCAEAVLEHVHAHGRHCGHRNLGHRQQLRAERAVDFDTTPTHFDTPKRLHHAHERSQQPRHGCASAASRFRRRVARHHLYVERSIRALRFGYETRDIHEPADSLNRRAVHGPRWNRQLFGRRSHARCRNRV